MNVFAWHFPIYILSFNEQGKRTQRKEVKSIGWEKKIMPHLYNSLRCQGVSNDGRVCSLRGHIHLGRKDSVFPRRDVYRASSSCESHCDDKHLPSSTLKDTGIKQGWYPSKVSEMSARFSQPHSGLMLLSWMGLPLSIQGRTYLQAIRLAELVADSMTSSQHGHDLSATLKWLHRARSLSGTAT